VTDWSYQMNCAKSYQRIADEAVIGHELHESCVLSKKSVRFMERAPTMVEQHIACLRSPGNISCSMSWQNNAKLICKRAVAKCTGGGGYLRFDRTHPLQADAWGRVAGSLR
jgi:hypothetical protein